ncbi:MAG: hypothetical protein MUF50_00475 [Planctomycetes bacterium]|jgi:hypothetical protein|nr:hypothetical protein [Planctomycetota bacterium]
MLTHEEKIIVENIENDKVFLKDEKGQILSIPKNYFIEPLSLGQEIFLSLSDQTQGKTAKDIINELLTIE